MTDSPVTVDELYSKATHASNLRVELDANRRSQADVLIAAAWNPSRLGSALLRLHSEADGTARPRRISREAVDALALSMGIHHSVAVKMSEAWYRNDVGIMMMRLKTLPEVRHQLTMQADKWGIFRPADVVAGVLIWWLDRQCPQCHGLKFQIIEGTPSLSHKLCKLCRGTGEARLPHMGEGRRLANHIEDCIGMARQNIRKRLRPG